MDDAALIAAIKAGTIAGAATLLRERGARSVRVACVHPLFAQRAYDQLDDPDLITEIVFTDSVPVARAYTKVPTRTLSLAPMVGDAIKRIHTGGSVGELFR